MTQWKKELEGKREYLKVLKRKEHDLKVGSSNAESFLKVLKRDLRRSSAERLSLQNDVNNFWRKKRQMLYNRRQWAKNNFGKVWDDMERKGAAEDG